MKIESSNVQMDSVYSASQTVTTEITIETGYGQITEHNPGGRSASQTGSLSLRDQAGLLGAKSSASLFSISTSDTLSVREGRCLFQQRLLKHVIETLWDMLQNRNFITRPDKADALTSDNFTGQTQQQGFWYRKESWSTLYYEEEYTTFDTTGVVKTSDGRELSFSLDMSLSRSFLEATSMEFASAGMIVTQDPLVINLDVPSASITDQKFFFDIDGDGKKEEISSLGRGSGFLALDKNGDGVINDGSELFGPGSGNGFVDLAVYDSDGNGWIDENDSIFSQLKVWTKNEDGSDRLLSLKEADVGAIFLGNVYTGFDVKEEDGVTTKARIQNTGIYLRESTGQAGTVQQVDFAWKA
ncbi:MAG: hypothetical protein J1F02_00680 [Lachnospiraceae bacterium]|nr:hypothetical protein [Lachnospiraceae bacterium]